MATLARKSKKLSASVTPRRADAATIIQRNASSKKVNTRLKAKAKGASPAQKLVRLAMESDVREGVLSAELSTVEAETRRRAAKLRREAATNLRVLGDELAQSEAYAADNVRALHETEAGGSVGQRQALAAGAAAALERQAELIVVERVLNDELGWLEAALDAQFVATTAARATVAAAPPSGEGAAGRPPDAADVRVSELEADLAASEAARRELAEKLSAREAEKPAE